MHVSISINEQMNVINVIGDATLKNNNRCCSRLALELTDVEDHLGQFITDGAILWERGSILHGLKCIVRPFGSHRPRNEFPVGVLTHSPEIDLMPQCARNIVSQVNQHGLCSMELTELRGTHAR